MLGCGVVGSSVARLLQEDSGDFAARSGANLKLVKVAVKNLSTKRDFVSSSILTDDSASVVSDPSIDIVIEVMGGIEPARELILSAIKNGKSIITANKALLALHGAELFEAADKNKVDLYYEAAVAAQYRSYVRCVNQLSVTMFIVSWELSTELRITFLPRWMKRAAPLLMF